MPSWGDGSYSSNFIVGVSWPPWVSRVSDLVVLRSVGFIRFLVDVLGFEFFL
jgi:hypothetical protein